MPVLIQLNPTFSPCLTLSPDTIFEGEPINRKLITLIIWLAVVFSAAVFSLRGPLRARGDYANDFAAPYVSARLWLHHQDPYNPDLFWDTWRNAGAPVTDPGGNPIYANPSSTHSVYPPPSVVALSAFALLQWSAAWKTLIVLSTLAYLAAILLLARLLPGKWTDPYKPAFLAFCLLFAPTISALHTSNVTGLSASLLLIAFYLLLTPLRDIRAGISIDANSQINVLSIAILLALSISIKPTLAPVALLYLVVVRLWKILFTTLTTTALITAIFFGLRPPSEWLASLLTNIDFLFTSGAASLAEQNLTRSDRIDLQLPIYTMVHSRNIAASVALIFTLVLLAMWLRSSDHSLLDPSPIASTALLDLRLLSLSTLLVIGLLPFYQRFYSAMILLLPVLWASRNLARPRARWILAACFVFLVNTSVLPRRLGIRIPSAGPIAVLMDTLLTAHLCWLLLAISILLLRSVLSHTETLSGNSDRRTERNPTLHN